CCGSGAVFLQDASQRKQQCFQIRDELGRLIRGELGFEKRARAAQRGFELVGISERAGCWQRLPYTHRSFDDVARQRLCQTLALSKPSQVGEHRRWVLLLGYETTQCGGCDVRII